MQEEIQAPDEFRLMGQTPPSDARENWNRLAQQYAIEADRLGNGIDADIMETVVALNAHGIRTVASCEGHLDHGIAAPWVEVRSEDTQNIAELRRRSFQLEDEINREEREGEDEQRLDDLYRENLAVLKELRVHRLQELAKVYELLQLFYRQHPRDPDDMLVIQANGQIISNGAQFQEIRDDETQKRKLAAYQKEMLLFTEFLKRLYFDSNST